MGTTQRDRVGCQALGNVLFVVSLASVTASGSLSSLRTGPPRTLDPFETGVVPFKDQWSPWHLVLLHWTTLHTNVANLFRAACQGR